MEAGVLLTPAFNSSHIKARAADPRNPAVPFACLTEVQAYYHIYSFGPMMDGSTELQVGQ